MESAQGIESRSSPRLTRYRNFHLWMMLPFAVVVLGFSSSYFLVLPQATFHQHVHGLSATLWFALVIIQPWLITRGHRFAAHRSLGIIGLVLAGIVAGSALAIIPRNIDNVETLPIDGVFNPTFAYFATYLDALLIGLFIFSVTLSILRIRKGKIADHVQWLLASVLLILSPALIRLLLIGAMILGLGEGESIRFIDMILPSALLMLLIIGIYYYRFGSLRHPSFILLMISLLPLVFVGWIGDNETLRSLANAIFKS